MINNLKKTGTWTIKLTVVSNFISSICYHEERVIYIQKVIKSEILINDEADKVIKELFDSLRNRYQNNLESIKGSVLFFYWIINVIKQISIMVDNK